MPKIIGITGRAGAGKDTLAGYLVVNHGYRQAAFADTLKKVLALIACEPLDNFYNRERKEAFSPALGMTRREAMQKIGTEVGRNLFGPMVWCDATITRWIEDGQAATVIADVRFDNEAEAIIAEGGVIVRVVRDRPDAPKTWFARAKAWVTGQLWPEHLSEAGVSDHLVTFEVPNNGTIDDLEEPARVIAEAVARMAAEATSEA